MQTRGGTTEPCTSGIHDAGLALPPQERSLGPQEPRSLGERSMSTAVTQELPKLRSDLVISRQGGAVVLKDPATGRFFRFGEAEHFITTQLDGTTPLAVVRRWAGEEFGSLPEPGIVEGFVESLKRLGLLEADDATLDRPVARRRRTRGSPLYLRLSAFDPDRLLDRLVGKVGFCFTP